MFFPEDERLNSQKQTYPPQLDMCTELRHNQQSDRLSRRVKSQHIMNTCSVHSVRALEGCIYKFYTMEPPPPTHTVLFLHAIDEEREAQAD